MDWEPVSDYDDQMDAVERGLVPYDDVHCVHGTFVGNWAGPDYMCGACESGISDEEWLAGKESARIANEKRAAARTKWNELTTALVPGDKVGFEAALEWLKSEEGSWLSR